jgi:hypothetical protein
VHAPSLSPRAAARSPYALLRRSAAQRRCWQPLGARAPHRAGVRAAVVSAAAGLCRRGGRRAASGAAARASALRATADAGALRLRLLAAMDSRLTHARALLQPAVCARACS